MATSATQPIPNNPLYPAPIQEPKQVASADGAITLLGGGVVFITKGSAAALTLADPAVDGVTLTIVSTTAAAHTVTNTTGFGGGTTSRDVATWGGAINDSMVLKSYNGVWWVVSTRNVSLG